MRGLKRFSVLFGVGAATVLAAVSSVGAIGTNGSFEDGANSPGAFWWTATPGSNQITGWTVVSGQVDHMGTYWQASDGNNSIDLNGLIPGAITQTFATVPGATYLVRFDMSGNPDDDPGLKTMVVSATGAAPETHTYDTSVGNTRTNMMYELRTYRFRATGASTTLTFQSTTGGSPAWYGPVIDNVRIRELVPSKEACKNGGWQVLLAPTGEPLPFKNQGDCVSYFATGGKNLPAGE